jgi:hypothetical protein
MGNVSFLLLQNFINVLHRYSLERGPIRAFPFVKVMRSPEFSNCKKD